MASLKARHCLSSQVSCPFAWLKMPLEGRKVSLVSVRWILSWSSLVDHIRTLYFIVVEHAERRKGFIWCAFWLSLLWMTGNKRRFKQKCFAALSEFTSLLFCSLFSFSACFAYIIHILLHIFAYVTHIHFLSSNSRSFLDSSLPLIPHLFIYVVTAQSNREAFLKDFRDFLPLTQPCVLLPFYCPKRAVCILWL